MIMSKVRFATVWMDGCSGCHMSLLDMDERLIEILSQVDLVYSPLVDAKEFPENVDVVLIEGAVSSEEDLEKIHKIRARSKVLISLGRLRRHLERARHAQPFQGGGSRESRLHRKRATSTSRFRGKSSRAMLPHSRPVHEHVKVDLFVPGCPPEADTIHFVLTELLAGRMPDLTGKTHFGA